MFVSGKVRKRKDIDIGGDGGGESKRDTESASGRHVGDRSGMGYDRSVADEGYYERRERREWNLNNWEKVGDKKVAVIIDLYENIYRRTNNYYP